jgi:hypothetical protein
MGVYAGFYPVWEGREFIDEEQLPVSIKGSQ